MSKKNIKQNRKTGANERVYVYFSKEDKAKLKELSRIEMKSVSFMINELVQEKLKTLIRLELKFDEGEEKWNDLKRWSRTSC